MIARPIWRERIEAAFRKATIVWLSGVRRSGKTVLADKIYSDFSFFNESNPVKVLTPHKEIKGEPEVLKQREKAARDLFSQAVSKVRQPIESFFNWLNEKTEIQRASKVRATKGLLVHTFGKLAIALLTFVNF